MLEDGLTRVDETERLRLQARIDAARYDQRRSSLRSSFGRDARDLTSRSHEPARSSR